MKRSNEYEAAFEGYLRANGLCYVAVDETRRSVWGRTRVKSLDFVVYTPAGARLLVDVKGRRFPCGREGRQRRVWECWSEREDLEGLRLWAELFGPGYLGLLVFAYALAPNILLPNETPDVWEWRGKRYLFRAIAAEAYRERMRTRSPRWDTVSLGCADFRELVQPLQHFTGMAAAVAEEMPF